MIVWPEGRMEFVCTGPAQEGGCEQRWLGEVMVKSHSMGMAELIIYGRDSCINAVIGKYMSGQYICIPDIDTGCPLSRPSGIHRAACLRIVYGLGTISDKDTKCSIQRCQIITGRRMEKAVQKAAVNWEVNNCVYNWTSDRKTGRFATANEVKSVTSHEVINNTFGISFFWKYVWVDRHIEYCCDICQKSEAWMFPFQFDCLQMPWRNIKCFCQFLPCYLLGFTKSFDVKPYWSKVKSVSVFLVFFHFHISTACSNV